MTAKGTRKTALHFSEDRVTGMKCSDIWSGCPKMEREDMPEQAEANSGVRTVDSTRQQRERSQIRFPYTDIGQAIELSRVLQDQGGGTAEREQLAAWMDQSAAGGTFRSRVSAAALFDFIRADGTSINITSLGRKVLDGARKDTALAKAFLKVPLFLAMFEKHSGYPLPPAAAIERQVVEFGVPDKQKERARQTFSKSASLAGFIDSSTGRFVKPAVRVERAEEVEAPDKTSEPDKPCGARSGFDSGGKHYHPFIKGLLDALPDPGVDWPHRERAKWLRLAASAFDFVYKADGEGEIEIKEVRASTATHEGPPS